MSWRKWLVRGLVFSIVGALACAGWLYERLTNPDAVREQVLAKLQETFPAANVTLDSARLRILGGIALTEVRLVRRDDETRTDFVYIPSALLYHDKEQLLDGKLAFRKITLTRPRLRAVRDKDGRWNLSGLLKPSPGEAPIPTLVIEEGTLLLEDRTNGSGQPPLELTNVHLTVINDPVATITLEGLATLEGGRVELHGVWQRDTHEATLTVQAQVIPVTTALLSRLGPCAGTALSGVHLEGTADLKASLDYNPAAAEPLTYDLHCDLHKGKLQHPRLSLPLEQIELSADCAAGKVTLNKLTAVAEGAQIEADGWARLPWPDQTFAANLSIKHLDISDRERLCKVLPEQLGKLHHSLEPNGRMTIALDCARQGGQWQRLHCVLHPEHAAICYAGFQYPVKGITGTIDCDLREKFLKIDLTGQAGAQPVFMQGYWKGAGPAADVHLDLRANNVALDDPKLLKALPHDVQPLAMAFHAQGFGDVRALIRHVPGSDPFANEYHVRFSEAAIRWDAFPYAVHKVTGVLDIYPDHWQFRDFVGTHNGGTVKVSGHSEPREPGHPPGEAPHLLLDIAGQNIEIGADLRAAVQPMPGLAKAWDTFGPAGRLDFAAKIDRMPGGPQDLDISVDVHGCSIKPHFFDYDFSDLSGLFRYTRNRLEINRVHARHKDTQVRIERGTVDIAPGGGFYADLQEVSGNPVLPEGDFVKALPKGLRRAFETLQMHEPFAVKTRLVIAQDEEPGSQPDIYWDGALWLRKAKLQMGVECENVSGMVACVGRHNGRQVLGLNGNLLLEEVTVLHQPFHNVHTKFQVRDNAPDVLLLGLKAPIYGGEVSGQARIEFNSTLRYELNLTASEIDLTQFGRENIGARTELSGQAWGRLHLTGQGDSMDTLDGNGSLHVPQGPQTRLANLPFLLDLLKFLGLRWPDRTMFEEAHAEVSVHGQRVSVNRLDLWGNAISLTGKGEINLNGSNCQLDFYPSWARVEQLLPEVIRELPVAVSKNLLKIEVRGKVGGKPEELQFYKRPVPALVDPLLQLRDRVSGEQKK